MCSVDAVGKDNYWHRTLVREVVLRPALPSKYFQVEKAEDRGSPEIEYLFLLQDAGRHGNTGQRPSEKVAVGRATQASWLP
jgi:hypothetical protein